MFGLDEKPNIKIDDNKTAPTRQESLAKLMTVISAVEKYYVDDVKLDAIVNKAISGLMTELDAHSTYMDPKSYKAMNESMEGEFEGLGIVIEMKDGALTVISPIDDTPAFKAGVKSGDIILKINDKSTLKMTIDDAITLMRGAKGTPIELTVVRKNEPKPLKIGMLRGVIKVKSVNAKTYENGILYLRISSFDNNVAEQLSKFITDNKATTKGIVLDLRNNPGGSLEQSVMTVDLFVDEGVIVSQKGKIKSEDSSFSATKKATLTKVPMVVLVNGGSASASEIVSGALQDFKRAVIIGEDTFGKGSVQMLMPIKNDKSEAIKLTIAKYYLPSGRTIQAKGVIPDIKVQFAKAQVNNDDRISIKEKDLKKHLEGELKKADEQEVVKKDKKEIKSTTKDIKEVDEQKETRDDELFMDEKKKIITDEDLAKDNQLKSGIDVLKSLILMGK
ncbi:MAG: S41 family peptidase [Arcobacter sp.]|nr:S41 family peptidase [Arcobacter sp.]